MMGNRLRIVTTDTPAMDPDEERAASDAFARAFVVVGHLTRLADARLADWDLTTRQWLLLAVLAQGFPGRAPSLSEAAAAYGTSRQNVKQIAIGLESRGFVHLVPDGSDGRMTRLVLTDRIRIFDEPEGLARGRDLLASAFDGLAPHDVLALNALLGRWIEALGREHPTPAGRVDIAGEP
jgi:DNA-binding MarR family transcriptional regulator